MASAVVCLKLYFIGARGEHFPLETPAGGSEAKFKEQSLPPWLGCWASGSDAAPQHLERRPRSGHGAGAGRGGGGTGEVAQGKTLCTQLPGSGFTPV